MEEERRGHKWGEERRGEKGERREDERRNGGRGSVNEWKGEEKEGQ